MRGLLIIAIVLLFSGVLAGCGGGGGSDIMRPPKGIHIPTFVRQIKQGNQIVYAVTGSAQTGETVAGTLTRTASLLDSTTYGEGALCITDCWALTVGDTAYTTSSDSYIIQDSAGAIRDVGDSVHGKITLSSADPILYPSELQVGDVGHYLAEFASYMPISTTWEVQAREPAAGFMALKIHQYRYGEWHYEWYVPAMAGSAKVQCSLPYSGTKLDVTAEMQSRNF